MKPIYLDNSATTKVRKEVVKSMNKVFLEDYGNPGSLHEKGEKALKIIEDARKKIASEINARPEEIIFTSGATESNNIALKCFPAKKIIISSIEHPSIEETAKELKAIKINVDEKGKLDLKDLESKIVKGSLVSVIHGNNIFGTIQDLKAIGKICKEKGAYFHTDATQTFGKYKIDVKNLGIDLLSASAHKIGGPKGIGLLYVRKGINLKPFLFGGGQEKGIRSGTENVPGIAGFVKALELEKKVNHEKISKLRDKLISELEKIGKINGSKDRLYNNVHISFPGVDNETLVYRLSHKGIYVSAGSACDSKKEKEDHVLKAIGLTKKEIDGSLRISIGEDFKEKDIKRVVEEIRRFPGIISD